MQSWAVSIVIQVQGQSRGPKGLYYVMKLHSHKILNVESIQRINCKQDLRGLVLGYHLVDFLISNYTIKLSFNPRIHQLDNRGRVSTTSVSSSGFDYLTFRVHFTISHNLCTYSVYARAYQKLESLSVICENCSFALNVLDPTSYKEVIKVSEWLEAISKELNAILRKETWKLSELPTWKKLVGPKWVFNTEYYADGKVHRYKP